MDSSEDINLTSPEKCLFDRFLKCVVCKKAFDDCLRHCRLLPCLHNICSTCIHDVYYSGKENETICQECKTIHIFQHDYSKAFPEDNTKWRLLNFVQQNHLIPCERCGNDNSAICLCKICNMYLCQTCKDDHMIKYNFHTILQVPKGTVNPTEQVAKCSVPGHDDEDIDMFCSKKECGNLICRMCASANHKPDNGHVVIPIENSYKKEKEKILTEKTKAMTTVKQIEDTMSSIENQLAEIEEYREKVLDDIHLTFGKDIDNLISRRDDLSKQVNELEDKQYEELLTLKSTLRNQKIMIEDCITFFDYSILSQSTSELERIAPTVTSRFRYLNSDATIKAIPKQKSIEFLPCGFDAQFELKTKSLGEIIVHSSDGKDQQNPVKKTKFVPNTDFILIDPNRQQRFPPDVCESSEKGLCTFTFQINEELVEQFLLNGDLHAEEPIVSVCQIPDDRSASFEINGSEQDKINTYPVPVFVVKNELASEVADVIVNTTSKDLQLNLGTVSSSLLKTAGKKLHQECRKIAPRGINYGEFVVTDGYNLRCKKVYHGALPPYDKGGLEMLEKLMMGCLHTASRTEMLSICFPAFGTGILQYPKVTVAETMFNAAETFFKTKNATQNSIRYIKFVVHPKDKETCQIFEDEDRRRKPCFPTQ